MTFRILNMITVPALAILVAVHCYLCPLHWWYFVLFAWVYASLVFVGCIKLSMNFFVRSVCSAKTTEKIVALTFDDGPAQYTHSILDTLKQHNVTAAFFCIGKNIPGNEQTLLRIKQEGHIIGNHSYSHHFWFDMWGSQKMLDDLHRMDAEAMKVTGIKPWLFRPPYGVMNPNLARAVIKGRYVPIGWSIRSFDTKINDRQKLLSRIIGQVKPGGIILLHDSMEITAAILPELIELLKQKGYSITGLKTILDLNIHA